ncbi:LysE family translocator [Thalassospira mesophila]|uniref:Lysine transporter LysE n=1 Tax=Thalassospira mesophila TaxID=1293891 RepID=A0A1Y2L2P8_9PROT|nr:LysE family transporter [Thalassospira mesophila]OSQ39615.1 lysine transporter LysE [Thalassospira mesophila]
MSFDTWLVFAGAAFALSMAPGPNNLMAMFNGARHGVGASATGGVGRLLAFAIMIVVTATGLGVVLAASEVAFGIIKYAGAAYLVYLGVKTWRSHVSGHDDTGGMPGDDLIFQPRPNAYDLARREFLTAMGNPKAILIFTAFFPQFLNAQVPYGPQFAVMGVTFLVMEACVLLAYGLVGGQVKGFVRSARHLRLLNRVSGGVLIGAGAVLAAARR